MIEDWIKWFLLCFFATFPYSLVGFFMFIDESSVFFVSGFLLFTLFVTAFFALDKSLIRKGFRNFSQYFQDMVVFKLVIMLVLAILTQVVKTEYLTTIMTIDFLTAGKIAGFLILNGKETLETVFQNPEYYAIFERLLLIIIFLIVEGFYLIFGTIVLKWYKNKFK